MHENTLAQILNFEFRRVASAEDIAMETLVDEVASLAGCKPRQIYKFRSGKQAIPHTLFPILCRRFKSTIILDTLRDACSDTKVEIPDTFELTRLVTTTVRDDLRHYERFIDAFDSDGIDGNELAELETSGARIVQNTHMFLEIARRDHQQRQARHAAVTHQARG